MMYTLKDGALAQADALDPAAEQLVVLPMERFSELSAICPESLAGLDVDSFVRHTQAVEHPDCFYGALNRPSFAEDGADISLFFLISRTHFAVLARTDGACEQIAQALARAHTKRSLHRIACQFFADAFQRDARELEQIEDSIDELEDMVLGDVDGDFDRNMAVIRRQIREKHLNYERCEDVAELFLENEYGVFTDDAMPSLRQLSNYIARLAGSAQMLREYALQVRDMRQTRIAVKQNQIMQVLTVVTTIFLPLSLIASWYGMNFAHMPELDWEHGYTFVILLSLLVVALCTWFFRRKKYM